MKSNGISGVAGATMMAAKAAAITDVSPASSTPGFDVLLNQKTAQGTADVMDLASGNSNNAAVMQPQQSYEKGLKESGYREIAKADNSKTMKQAEGLQEEYQELKEEITEEFTEELNVSEEELKQAMEVLGITFADLANGKGIKELMMQLTGAEDMTELLFSDAFQTISQNLESLVEGFTMEAELTPEEWDMVLQKLEEAEYAGLPQEEAGVPDMADSEIIPEELTAEEGVLDTPFQQTANEVETRKAAEPAEELFREQPKDQEVERAGELKEAEPVLEQEKEASGEEDGFTQDLSKKQTGKELKTEGAGERQQTHQVTYQQTQTTVNALGETVTQTVEQTAYVDVEDIIHQIAEFTKVTVQQAQSSIEMQLNPAHLGKIYLQVAVKEGMITAQIAAQNEAVKQALETQAAVLKENLNQQGLKVEAVEVTIASHEFEQNLESGEQRQADGEAGRESRGSRRFLSAERLDELAGTLTEEESLAAKIMLENGNSVDMTA